VDPTDRDTGIADDQPAATNAAAPAKPRSDTAPFDSLAAFDAWMNDPTTVLVLDATPTR
jgi:hypothetical protein